MSRVNIVRFLLFVYLVVVLVVTIIPTGSSGKSLNNITVLSLRADYLIHALIFLPLVPLWKVTFPRHRLWWVMLIGFVIAALAEISHYYLPYRAYNVNDLLFNMLGVLLGGLAVFLMIPHQNKQFKNKV